MRPFYLMFALMFAACEAEVPLHVASPPVSAPDPRRNDDESFFQLMNHTVVGELGDPILLRLKDPSTLRPTQVVYVKFVRTGVKPAAELTPCRLSQNSPRCFLHRPEHANVGLIALVNHPSFALEGYFCGEVEALTQDGWVGVQMLAGPTARSCLFSVRDRPIRYDAALNAVEAAP